MSLIRIVEAPASAPADCDVRTQSIRTLTPTRRAVAVAVAWLVLGCLAATAISLYFNVPAMWNPPGPRRVARFYNPHPPLAYGLVSTDGSLNRAAAWCHLLAVLLSAAALRVGARPGSQSNWHWTHRRQLADPSHRFLFGLMVFHATLWWGHVTDRCCLASALAALAAVVTWYACVAGRSRSDGKRSERFPVPHVPSLLLFGAALTLGAPLAQCAIPPLATRVADARQAVGDPAFSADYARAWAQLLGASALLTGLIVGRFPSERRGQRRLAPLRLLALAGVATVTGAGVFWYRQPLPRFGEAVPDVLYHSAQPGSWSLALAQRRYCFRTIVYLHEETNTAAHADEVQFARRRGIRLIDVASSNWKPEDLLRLTRDPSARPILMHCIEGQNRTPSWLALYRIVEQGWSLPEAYAEMERISGQRLKTYLADWVEQAAARLEGAAPSAGTREQAQ